MSLRAAVQEKVVKNPLVWIVGMMVAPSALLLGGVAAGEAVISHGADEACRPPAAAQTMDGFDASRDRPIACLGGTFELPGTAAKKGAR